MIYVFGDYELNTAHYELSHQGVALQIEPKAFDLLAYLIQHHGQVITKEALHEYLWPDQFVSDSALTYYIATARKAVGDSGRTQHLIKTVYSRGYSFIAPVQEQPLSPPPLESPAPPPPEPDMPTSSPSRLDGERRQLTVICGRLLVLAAPGQPLDPEEQHDLSLQVQAIYQRILEAHSGHLAQHLSHGFIAYFGYPQAHEEDARWAVQAGLDIVHAIEDLQAQYRQESSLTLTTRIGIHTGTVVMGTVGQGLQQEQLALGETPHLTAELASIAPSNTVVISPFTLQLVEGYFIHRELGGYYLEELDLSIAAHHVLHPSGRQSRLEATPTPRLTPFIGREQEVGLLYERWEQAQAGMGQVVLIGGEAGIGKSRLVQALYDHMGIEEPAHIACRCSSSTQNSAFYPIIGYLERVAQLDRADAPEERLEKVKAALQRRQIDPTATLPLLAPLFSLPVTDQEAPVTHSPKRRHDNTLAILLAWLLQEANTQSGCIIQVEDVHWADPSTIDLLTLLVDQVATTSIMLLVTFRPEFQPPWPARSHLGHITLNRLSPQQVDHMILQVTRQKSLPTALHQQLVDKTDGVPLFIEEMTRMVLESGLVKEKSSHYELIDTLSPLAVPATLHDSLMARLDRLGRSKDTAQLAATIGREFSYQVIQAVSPLEESDLRQTLDQLVNSELLYQRGLFPHSHYIYKHALIQETAYQSLLRSTRKYYHQQIAQVLEERFPETRQTQPELLAYHFTGAESYTAAIAAWQQASQHAMSRAAYVEAISHLEQALALIPMFPNTATRCEDELSIQLALGTALTATQGYAGPEVEPVYRRARELCLRLDHSPHLSTVLQGLWLINLTRGYLHSAIEVGEHLLQLAETSLDIPRQLDAHRAVGTGLFFQGEFVKSYAHFDQGITLYEAHPQHIPADQSSQHPGTICLVYIAWLQWLQGYPDQAMNRIESAVTLAQQQDPWTHAVALQVAAVLNHGHQNVEAVHASTVACLDLVDDHMLPLFVALTQTFQGWVLSKQGKGKEGIAKIRQGLASYRDTGSRLACTYILAILAEVYLDCGEIEAALTTLDEAKTIGNHNIEWWWKAECHRLSGECLLAQASRSASLPATVVQEAEVAFQQALTTAKHQQAKLLELRAALSLSRLWQQQGRPDKIRQVLTDLYASFTEGHHTAELIEARSLLEACHEL